MPEGPGRFSKIGDKHVVLRYGVIVMAMGIPEAPRITAIGKSRSREKESGWLLEPSTQFFRHSVSLCPTSPPSLACHKYFFRSDGSCLEPSLSFSSQRVLSSSSAFACPAGEERSAAKESQPALVYNWTSALHIPDSCISFAESSTRPIRD